MIRVNGVPLNNEQFGWVFREGSMPYSGYDIDLTQVNVAGRDGHVSIPSTTGSPMWPLKVNTPPSGWEALQALFRTPTVVLTRDDNPNVEIVGRLASSNPNRVFDRNEWIDVTFIVELTGAFWRSKLESTVSPVLSSASQAVTVFPGLSAPVQDAVVRVTGASGVLVTDSSGAWVSLPDAASGEWVRFESDTGRCFVTTTDAWSGGDEISGLVDFGGPRGVFEVMPRFDPATLVRSGRLTVSSVSRSGAVFSLRGRSAHAL